MVKLCYLGAERLPCCFQSNANLLPSVQTQILELTKVRRQPKDFSLIVIISQSLFHVWFIDPSISYKDTDLGIGTPLKMSYNISLSLQFSSIRFELWKTKKTLPLGTETSLIFTGTNRDMLLPEAYDLTGR